MGARSLWLAGAFVLVLLGSGFAAAAPPAAPFAPTIVHATNPAPMLSKINGNWAGYYVFSTSLHKVTAVKGSWVVPKLKSSCTSGGPTTAFFGIGMDGWKTSSTSFETLGVVAACSSSGRSYIVDDVFWTTSFSLGGPQTLKVSPGNIISAEIKYQSGSLLYSLTNHNTSKSFHATFANAYAKLANRDSAEWFSTVTTATPYLAPYGTAKFGPAYTGLKNSDTTNISGITKPIRSHLNLVQSDEYRSGILQATSGALSTDKQSFVTTWKHV